MGNYKIKLSDMFPNAWLYKLKGMGSSRPKTHQKRSKRPAKKKPSTPPPRQSHCYYTLDSISKPKFSDSPAELIPSTTVSPDPPRKCKKKKRAPTTFSSSMSAGCSFHASFGSDRRPLVVEPLNNVRSWSSSCCCGVVSSAAADIVIELDGKESLNSKRDRFDHGFDTRPGDGKTTFSREFDEFDSCFDSIRMVGKGSFELEKFDDEHLLDTMPELELPPILVRPPKFSDLILELKEQKSTSKFGCSARMEGKSAHSYYEPHASAQVMKEESISARRSTSSRGVRIRASSPRLASKKIQLYNRRNSPAATRRKRVAESIAVVKSSSDPLRDFKDSMVEMIVENNIETSKDLEDLLACYLSLNSSEYHDVIVQVFVQIWLDLTDKFL